MSIDFSLSLLVCSPPQYRNVGAHASGTAFTLDALAFSPPVPSSVLDACERCLILLEFQIDLHVFAEDQAIASSRKYAPKVQRSLAKGKF